MRIDDAAVNEFLHTAYPRLVAAVALVCSSRPAAEDAVQEALLRAWERSEKGEEIEHLNAWVATVALNLARSGLRRVIAERKARTRLAAEYHEGPGPSGDRVDVERALATLPRRQREAVVLRYYLQMDTREVAEVLHMSEGTTFLLKGTFLNVVDVTEFTWPIDDERRPFLDTGGCGTDLST